MHAVHNFIHTCVMLDACVDTQKLKHTNSVLEYFELYRFKVGAFI